MRDLRVYEATVSMARFGVALTFRYPDGRWPNGAGAHKRALDLLYRAEIALAHARAVRS